LSFEEWEDLKCGHYTIEKDSNSITFEHGRCCNYENVKLMVIDKQLKSKELKMLFKPHNSE
jgi:hypothetical protein